MRHCIVRVEWQQIAASKAGVRVNWRKRLLWNGPLLDSYVRLMSSDDKFKSLALLCTFGSANQLIVYHFFLLRCIMHMLLWFSDWSEYFYETTSHTHYTFRWTNAIETGHERTTIARIHTCLSKCFREKKNYIFFAWIIELLTFFSHFCWSGARV